MWQWEQLVVPAGVLGQLPHWIGTNMIPLFLTPWILTQASQKGRPSPQCGRVPVSLSPLSLHSSAEWWWTAMEGTQGRGKGPQSPI